MCDFVADKRAVTPSEAAEFVTVDVVEQRARVCAILDKIQRSVARQIADRQNYVVSTVRRLDTQVERTVERQRTFVLRTLDGINEVANTRIAERNSRLEKYLATLNASNPTRLLARGYAYVTKDGQNVKSVKQVASGDKLSVTLYDGKVEVTAD